MVRLLNMLLIASILLGLSVSAPITHAHELDESQLHGTMHEVADLQVLLEPDQNNPHSGDSGVPHNCCSHHCHAGHAMLGTDFGATLALPAPPQLSSGADDAPRADFVFTLKRPPRTV